MNVNVYRPRGKSGGIYSYIAAIHLTEADHAALGTTERHACERLARGIEQMATAPAHPFLVLGPGPVLLEHDDEESASAAAYRLARTPGGTATVIHLGSVPRVVWVATDDGVRPQAPC